MSSSDSRPIFIVGAPRSGTTLLQYMLRSHPAISLPTGESHFFVPLYKGRTDWGDLSVNQNVSALLNEMLRRSEEFLLTDLHGIRFDVERLSSELVAAGINTIPDIIDYIYSQNAAGEGKARWGDKTPYYVFHMPMLLEMFPRAQFIHLVRDGRDCALSLIQRQDDFGVHNLHMAGRYWREYVDRGRELGQQLPPGTYIEVRYEDLLADPVSAMKGVMAFLGEAFSEKLIDFNKSKVPDSESKTPLVARPITASNKEKWRRSLNNWQIRVFESAAGVTLADNGYALETTSSELPIAVRAMYRLHNRITRYYRHQYINRKS